MIAPVGKPPVTIRDMSHDDLSMVSDIERRSYEFPWSHGVFRDCLLAGYNNIVLLRGDVVAGYGVLSVAAGEAHILNICVDPAYRSHGYGESLLDEMLFRARAATVRQVFLEVRPSNEPALGLYRKKGFHKVAERPAYYQAHDGREDAAVLSKKLVTD
ncbi:MAG: ribosomal protein S18-alanine N-acetyltransferase [Gammaproteobacteria bacterium]|nr:ribosomal protein S18-alanine N-acetyltransferase [Gammaproteobacteria bacterium]MBT8104263.1 ribosomal protein S18-alanine N-acetyltransferase [Gammaproteobacteria bacterium]NNF49102.1 ribosomal protein S18-alanine N-acetyltransferase [Woeseiaceae bacterium]NNK24278.1 ribosomal protein S18-alanine N-acetyltransferase [Woeseiaceae bacterium]NNL63835.1 ribosomal protein S18-alanine N-acetyltransferase [Woeseiaceae bacterium]